MDVVIDDLVLERGGRTVLSATGLGFRSGTATAVFGPNGSGKSTLLRLIAGLERPTRGSVRVAESPGQWRAPRAEDIALGFQTAVFVRGTVRHNLDLALRLRRVERRERTARILESARECGIEPLLDRSARHLSAGEAQRTGLARALALRAPVTLLDEPLAAIDRATRVQLLDDLPRLLGTFASTTLLVTHDREEAFRLADQIVILYDGQVRAAGSTAAVYARPPDPVTAELLGYTVLRAGARLLAVPPGGLALATSEPALRLEVRQVIGFGDHRHVIGTVNGARVDLRLPPGAEPPRCGDTILVSPRSGVELRETSG